jgi:hypothetical protein
VQLAGKPVYNALYMTDEQLEELRGTYAFIILDETRQRLNSLFAKIDAKRQMHPNILSPRVFSKNALMVRLISSIAHTAHSSSTQQYSAALSSTQQNLAAHSIANAANVMHFTCST